MDNILLNVHNSSYHTQPHSIIFSYTDTSTITGYSSGYYAVKLKRSLFVSFRSLKNIKMSLIFAHCVAGCRRISAAFLTVHIIFS